MTALLIGIAAALVALSICERVYTVRKARREILLRQRLAHPEETEEEEWVCTTVAPDVGTLHTARNGKP